MSGKRLTFKQRVKIELLIQQNQNLKASIVAKEVGVHKTTIYNEIIKNRVSHGSKQEKFLNVKPTLCERITRFPFVCNSCPN